MKSVSVEPRKLAPLPGAIGNSPRSSSRASSQPEPDWQDLVYEHAPLAYLNFDSRGRLLDFNLAAAQLLGASRERDVRRPLADFIAPRHHRRLQAHVARSRSAREPFVSRLQLRSEPGSPSGIEVEISTRPVADAICYRTQLLPIAGNSPVAWPADDAKFRALVENSSEVICIGSPDGTIFYTTPSVERVLGYSAASWFGRNAFEIMRPDQAELARLAVRQLALTPNGTVLRLVTQVRHLDGSWRWVEGILTNLIHQPAVGGIVCNYRDITDSRSAEDAMRVSEQRYRLLAEFLPQLICIRDDAGTVLFCNSHWCEYRGISREKASTHDWHIGIPAEDLAQLSPPPWQTGLREPWSCEVRIRRASDGELRWHFLRVLPLPEDPGSAARWIAIATDIHERKQSEQERERLVSQLERQRAKLSLQYAILRILADSPGIADSAPALLTAFCDQLGWQAGALWTVDGASRPALSLVHIHQQADVHPAGLITQSRPTPPRFGSSLAGRVWEQKQPVSLSRLDLRRGPAHHRAAAAAGMRKAFAFPILLAGEVRGVLEFFTRGTLQPHAYLVETLSPFSIQIGLSMQRTQTLGLLRNSEEALIQANNVLEQRVRERTAELHNANAELSAEIAERTRLEREIILISEREQRRIGQDLHDGLCQELAAIAFMARALSTRIGAISQSEADRVDQVATLINASVSQCRDIARGLHPVEMDADGLMVALGDLAQRTNPAIACTFRCDEPILMPESDIALNLYRIAQEAVNNAVKYSRASQIIITLARQGSAVCLSIRDDGRGISVKSSRPRSKRDGMGLHTMRYRARTMGATLRVNSLQPHGTEILCLLPVPGKNQQSK